MMEIFKTTKAEKEQARLRLQNRPQTRGTDKEYYDSQLDTFESFRASRERVAKELELIEPKEGKDIQSRREHLIKAVKTAEKINQNSK